MNSMFNGFWNWLHPNSYFDDLKIKTIKVKQYDQKIYIHLDEPASSDVFTILNNDKYDLYLDGIYLKIGNTDDVTITFVQTKNNEEYKKYCSEELSDSILIVECLLTGGRGIPADFIIAAEDPTDYPADDNSIKIPSLLVVRLAVFKNSDTDNNSFTILI